MPQQFFSEKRYRWLQMTETRAKNFNNSPYPVRLGDLRPLLKQEAFSRDISVHHLIRLVIEGHFKMIKAHNIEVGKYRKHYGISWDGSQQLKIEYDTLHIERPLVEENSWFDLWEHQTPVELEGKKWIVASLGSSDKCYIKLDRF